MAVSVVAPVVRSHDLGTGVLLIHQHQIALATPSQATRRQDRRKQLWRELLMLIGVGRHCGLSWTKELSNHYAVSRMVRARG